jgi:predicted DNA-binding ribbon-helix-helix protein
MKSLVVKRSVVIAGHKTSVSLEDAFWKSLKEIANERDMTPFGLIGEINSERQHGNLSSAIRLFVLGFYRMQRLVVIEPTAVLRHSVRDDVVDPVARRAPR